MPLWGPRGYTLTPSHRPARNAAARSCTGFQVGISSYRTANAPSMNVKVRGVIALTGAFGSSSIDTT